MMPPQTCEQLTAWRSGKFGRLPGPLAAPITWLASEPDVPFDAKRVTDAWGRLMRQHHLHPLNFSERLVTTRPELAADVLLRLAGVPARIRRQALRHAAG